jgi:hypothetical protein
MLSGLFAGAAAALVLALAFVIRPRLAFRAAHLFEAVGRGRAEAAVRLFAVLAIAGAAVGALARL